LTLVVGRFHDQRPWVILAYASSKGVLPRPIRGFGGVEKVSKLNGLERVGSRCQAVTLDSVGGNGTRASWK